MSAVSALAQDVPPDSRPPLTCETGTAQRLLETSFLRASVFNTGSLFFGGSTTSGDGYIVPKGQASLGRRPGRPVSPVFAAGLWLGGRVDGELRVSAARYGRYRFWPGPLGPDGAAPTPASCAENDRIFVVSRQDLRDYYATGQPTADLRDWPHDLGAPVLDGDGIAGNYDLAAGDQPDLIGDVAAWWVMNDVGPDTTDTRRGMTSLGVEVRVLAFAYGEGVFSAEQRATYYRYEITNRGEVPIEEVYAAMFADPDLGHAGDDYIGTDTLGHMVFVYNDNEHDAVYGVPPAWGVQILQGPVGRPDGIDDDGDGWTDEVGEWLGATATSTFISGGPAGTQDPGRAEEYYNYMRGRWGDGTPITALGQGYQTAGDVTPFFYSGDPEQEAFWSQVNTDGLGSNSTSGDRRMVISTGPFRLAPDSTATLLYAMPFAQGTDWLNSVTRLKGFAQALQQASVNGFFASRRVEGPPTRLPERLALARVAPNPSAGGAVARLQLPAEARVRATVYDALGRRVAVVLDETVPTGETALSVPPLAAGTYLLRVQVQPGAEETLTFTVAR